MFIFIQQFCVSINAGGGFADVAMPHIPHKCIWNKPNLISYTTLCQDSSSKYAITFSQSLINSYFFNFGIGRDILMKVIKDCTIFITPAVWVLLIFILCKNKVFQSGALTENCSLISFYGKGWSRYSKINKFKISKHKRIHEKTQVSKATPIERGWLYSERWLLNRRKVLIY